MGKPTETDLEAKTRNEIKIKTNETNYKTIRNFFNK